MSSNDRPDLSDDLLARALRRVRQHTGAALGSASLLGVAAQAPALAGCAVDDPTLGEAAIESWSQDEGRRDPEMLRYDGQTWSTCRYPNSRFGCGALDVFVKLRVKPVAGVDLNWKKVGVVYRTVADRTERTALGYYFATGADGFEEWHVPVTVYSNQTTLLFDAWYQDGGGHTYVDDNQGELHVATGGTAPTVVRVEPWLNTVTVGPDGVRGRISVQLADLDYDKEVVLMATTDDWATHIELPVGRPGDTNRFYWVEDFPWSNFERWQIDLDLPGDVQRLQYAIGYRHGVRNGARVYAFWDNNYGFNYTVERPAPTEPEPTEP